MMLTRPARLAVIACHPEHISPASEWTHPSQTDSFDLLDGAPFEGARGESSKWRPAVGKFMLESKSAAEPASVVLRIVSPHTDAIMPILFTERTRGPADFKALHVFSIDQRLNVSLLRALRVHGDSMDVHVASSLEFNRPAARVCPIRGNRKITVVCSI